MLIVLSPAKRLDFAEPKTPLPATRARMMEDAASLARTARRQTQADLRRLMHLSEDLAKLNQARFKAFDPDSPDMGLQAAIAFAGDVYQGLDARSLDAEAMAFAQDHLRILSGLYGVLRPLDRLQPYRLEMGTRLKTRRGETLYDFWGDRISKQLNADAEGHADPTLVNLASQEYFGAVDAKALTLPIVTPQFREIRDGESRIISFFAKKARGLMARYAVEQRIENARDLKGFDRDGYRFDASASTETDWIFTRQGNN
ncbi:peroxide stress protein YaaA [Brevundimonas sp. S30B]|uniref:peroxide stress protein YaaA n=1 Tax=unclassified Brevundimonas TaxID=2622653 RepID=UPI001071D600|nr:MULTISPECIES: peroxide stress protein YaaA [unclassified Brevundimonas]QBX37392.1 peroxide stress protein YaaA [Brevundimonas sp. MF30-B]TFW03815.1 peroxide stress protein YaaA [Brevundimonas sp. S30B]